MGSIFKFSGESLLAWTSAYAIWEPISYLVIRALSEAKTIGEYYYPKRMPVPIVFFGDFIYSTFLLLVAQQVIPMVLKGGSPWLMALAVFLGIQWIGDFSFYKLITAIPSRSATRYVDFFQRYTKEVSVNAILGDSAYGIVWLTLAQTLQSYVSVPAQLTAIVLFLFGTLVVSY
jgi:hypothetical protein